MKRERVLGGIASFIAAAIVAATLAPATAQEHDGAVILAPVSEAAGFDARARVPVVESQLGIGSILSTDTAGRVHLGGVPDDHDGALLRVTVFDAPQDLSVFAAGAPAMIVPAGGSASTTVLVPLTESAVALYGSVNAEIRVEVLATFEGDSSAPGSTIALPEPVTRADTTAGLGGDLLDSTAASVGVTGRGGVPAIGVRAVYLTATIVSLSANVLTVGTQELPVPSGRASVTTVVTPGADGVVPFSLASGAGQLRVDVRGWIPEAPQDAARTNVPGSYVPQHSVDSETVQASLGTTTPVSLRSPADSAMALVLVSATPADDLTVVTVGAEPRGRSQGALVDPVRGALPQLLLAERGEGEALVSIRQGSASVAIAHVGDLLGATAPRSGSPTLVIDGPAEGADIDLAETDTLDLHGTVTTRGSSIESVRIEVDGGTVGAAALRYEDSGTSWSFATATPYSGDYEFTVRVTDRSGRSATETVRVAVTLPEVDETIVSDGAVVIAPLTSQGQPMVASLAEQSVTLAQQPAFVPGDVIVGDASSTAPEGFLRRVEAIDRTEGGWLVSTSPAALTDVILQADVEDEVDLFAVGEATVSGSVAPDEGDSPDVEVVDDSVPAIGVLSGDDVDVEPWPQEGSTESSIDLASARGAPAGPSLQLASFGVDSTLKTSLKVSGEYRWETGKAAKDVSKASEFEKDSTKAQIKANGGISLSGTAQIAVSLKVALKISLSWSWGIPRATVDDFQVVLSSDAKAALLAEAYLQAATTKSITRKVGEVNLPTVRFTVGPVPVVITSQTGVFVEARFGAQASVSAEVSVQRTEKYGFGYSSEGGFRTISDGPKTTYKTPVLGRYGDIEVVGRVDAAFGPRLDFDISIYDAAGPKFSTSAIGGAEASITQSAAGATAHVAVYLEAAAAGSVQLKIPIIDRVVLDAQLLSYNKRYVLASWDWDHDAAFTVIEPDPDPGPDPDPDPGPDPDPDPDPDPGPDDIIAADGGDAHSLALTRGGQVYVWGSSPLGDGTISDSPTGVLVSGLADVIAISAGARHSLALTRDGRVYSWGASSGGGYNGGGVTPREVAGLSNVVAISAGVAHSLAVTSDGNVFAWGNNDDGQLGDGTTTDRSTPVIVTNLVGVATVSAGIYHSLAVTSEGRVYSWGRNTNGQLGNGTTVSRQTPLLIPGLSNVAGVSAGWSHSLAVTSGGQAYSWGDGGTDQLGDGTMMRLSPAAVPGLGSVTGVAAGAGHSLATTSDGRVYAWGQNVYGELGDGTNSYRSALVEVPGVRDVSLTSAGSNHSLAVSRDGQIWAWGRNEYGQLGDGTTVDRYSATSVVRWVSVASARVPAGDPSVHAGTLLWRVSPSSFRPTKVA
jgi:alpha-tubulin suppressor-like RCC1 family protein